jgi:hypothetical protein
MTLNYRQEHLERFLSILTVVSKQAMLLAETKKRLFTQTVDVAWINGLSTDDTWGDVLESQLGHRCTWGGPMGLFYIARRIRHLKSWIP